MKKRLKILVLLLVTASHIVMAQPAVKAASKFPFHSFNSVQIINGSTIATVSLHSVNGFQLGKFFTGVGAGIDFYYHTTVPVFIEGRYDLFGTKRKLQCFADAGLQFPFAAMNKKLEYKTGSYNTGSMFAAGVDYFIPQKSSAIVLGIASSSKQVIQIADNNIWNPLLNRTENIPTKDVYQFNRIWIKIGLVF
jgi:hypothetical protein